MSNKEKAKELLRLAAVGKVNEAFDKYVSGDFIHHNPFFPGDRESLKMAMFENRKPDRMVDVKQLIEEGDRVAVFSHIRDTGDSKGMATVHIFRFRDGLVTEAWDISQQVPEDLANKHGMF